MGMPERDRLDVRVSVRRFARSVRRAERSFIRSDFRGDPAGTGISFGGRGRFCPTAATQRLSRHGCGHCYFAGGNVVYGSAVV